MVRTLQGQTCGENPCGDCRGCVQRWVEKLSVVDWDRYCKGEIRPPRSKQGASKLEPAKMNVVNLREELLVRGLSSSGRKAELVSKLQEALADEENAELPGLAHGAAHAPLLALTEEEVRMVEELDQQLPVLDAAEELVLDAAEELVFDEEGIMSFMQECEGTEKEEEAAAEGSIIDLTTSDTEEEEEAAAEGSIIDLTTSDTEEEKEAAAVGGVPPQQQQEEPTPAVAVPMEDGDSNEDSNPGWLHWSATAGGWVPVAKYEWESWDEPAHHSKAQ